MTGVYIGSTTPQAGKSLLSFSLGYLLQQKGYSVGYMKPLGRHPKIVEGITTDADALVAQEVLGQNVPPDVLTPYMLPANLHMLGMHQPANGEALDRIEQAYTQISANKDLTLVCGTHSFPFTGRVCNAEALDIVRRLHLKVMLVEPFDELCGYDPLLSLKDRLQENLAGIILNAVPPKAVRDVANLLVPFLHKQGIAVHGVIPHTPALLGMRVSDLAYGLSGYIVAGNASANRIVEDFIIGTMQVSNFMPHVKNNTDRVVVVGGDRADLQLAALLSGCPCMVLTGNFTPVELVRKRAESMGIPLIAVKEDTYAVARTMSHLLKTKKLRDLHHIKTAIGIVQEYLTLDTVIERLGLPQP